MNQKLYDALNDQINAELYSAYLYYSMAMWFADQNWLGMAHWMKVQSKEEQGHAEKIADYLVERNQRVVLKPIKGPETEWDSVLVAFEGALAHEQYITGRISDLVDLAREADDKAAELFLAWYVTEQVEEEANAQAIIDKLNMIGGAPQGMFMLDHALGERE